MITTFYLTLLHQPLAIGDLLYYRKPVANTSSDDLSIVYSSRIKRLIVLLTAGNYILSARTMVRKSMDRLQTQLQWIKQLNLDSAVIIRSL